MPTRREVNQSLEFYAVLSGKMDTTDCHYLGKSPTKRKQTESAIQAQLFQWAALTSKQHPELSLLFHIPNGEKRDTVTGARLKALGVKSGIPDMFLPIARNGYRGMFVELKAPGGRLQDTQKQWLTALAAQGYKAICCFGFDEARAAIEQYIGIT